MLITRRGKPPVNELEQQFLKEHMQEFKFSHRRSDLNHEFFWVLNPSNTYLYLIIQ